MKIGTKMASIMKSFEFRAPKGYFNGILLVLWENSYEIINREGNICTNTLWPVSITVVAVERL